MTDQSQKAVAGSVDGNSRGRGMEEGTKAPAADPSSVDASIAVEARKLVEAVEHTTYSADARFWMTPSTTVGDLQEWLDSLPLRSLDLTARSFLDFTRPECVVPGHEDRETFAFVVDTMPDASVQYLFRAWTPRNARQLEREEIVEPALSVDLDLDDTRHPRISDRRKNPNVYRVFRTSDLEDMHALARPDDPPEALAKGVLAISDAVTGFTLPVTSRSTIYWTAFSDGAVNRISVADAVPFRRRMSKYPQYYGKAPLDEAETRRQVLRMESLLDRITKEGLDPSSVWSAATESEIR